MELTVAACDGNGSVIRMGGDGIGPRNKSSLRIVVVKLTPKRYGAFLQNVASILTIRYRDQNATHQFWFVLNQQPGELPMFFLIHTRTPLFAR